MRNQLPPPGADAAQNPPAFDRLFLHLRRRALVTCLYTRVFGDSEHFLNERLIRVQILGNLPADLPLESVKGMINSARLNCPQNRSGDHRMAGAALRRNKARAQKAATRARPIDLVFLARQTLGDPGLEAEILSLFSAMATAYLKKVSDPRDQGDVAHGLHALKGAAAGIGAGAIAVEAAAAEAELAETGKVSAERLSDLAMVVEEVQVFISSLQAK
jgi:HPt (histidine-containing phosphotransfer) domain-containing protein